MSIHFRVFSQLYSLCLQTCYPLFALHSIRIFFSISFIPLLSDMYFCPQFCNQCQCRKLKLGCGPFPGRNSRERKGVSRHVILRTEVECILVRKLKTCRYLSLRFTDFSNLHPLLVLALQQINDE